MRSPSNARPRSGVGSLPVAIKMRAVSSVRSPTATRPGAVIRPVPRTHSILFFLKSPATPCVRPRTTRSFRAIMVGRSSSTPLTFTPCAASVRRTCQ